MNRYRASWECSQLGNTVERTIEAESREHAFSKLLSDTLYQGSLLLFLAENDIELDPAAADALEWEVLKPEIKSD